MATSSDGVLTVNVRPYAAVGIDIAWPSTPIPWRTKVTRTVGATTATVRSGDMAYTPGGSGYVQDNEAPIEGTLVYRAYGYNGTGALVRTSTTATLALSATTKTTWLKSIDNPHLNTQVAVADLDISMGVDAEVFTITGQKPIVWESGQSGYRGTLTINTRTKAMHDAVIALASAGTMLLQGSAGQIALPHDLYIAASSDVRIIRPARMPGWGVRQLTIPFVEVDRPDTAGSPLMIPGWSYDVRDAAYATYTLADAAFPSYNALAKGP